MSSYYKTPHLLLMVGNDVNFEDADTYYHQLDQMIARFNRLHFDVQLTHSTLSFFSQVVQWHDIPHASSYSDMMPISDHGATGKSGYNFFTGVYSARSNLKGLISRASSTLSAHNKLFAAQMVNPDLEWDKVHAYLNASNLLTQAVAEAQTQDGVTGISQPEMAEQIYQKLQDALEYSTKVAATIIQQASEGMVGIKLNDKSTWTWCVQSNLTRSMTYEDCPIKDHSASDVNFKMLVAVFNPATAPIATVRIAIPHANFSAQVLNASHKFQDSVG